MNNTNVSENITYINRNESIIFKNLDSELVSLKNSKILMIYLFKSTLKIMHRIFLITIGEYHYRNGMLHLSYYHFLISLLLVLHRRLISLLLLVFKGKNTQFLVHNFILKRSKFLLLLL